MSKPAPKVIFGLDVYHVFRDEVAAMLRTHRRDNKVIRCAQGQYALRTAYPVQIHVHR